MSHPRRSAPPPGQVSDGNKEATAPVYRLASSPCREITVKYKAASYEPNWQYLLGSLMIDNPLIKCMVVDDDHDGAEIVGEFLRVLGAEVKVVYGGQQAIDLAPHFQPRMVVLDLNMPTIDGFETCTRLRLQAWSHHAVIIAYTGLPAPKAIVMAAGFDHLVSKGDPPVIFETILNGITP